MNINILSGALTLSERYQQMTPALILLGVITLVMIVSSAVFTFLSKRVYTGYNNQKSQNIVLLMMYVATVLVLICTLLCLFRYRSVGKLLKDTADNTTASNTT